MSAASSVTATFSAGSSSGYSYQRTITIAHSQVPNTDQSNFPLLFSSTDPLLKSAANGGHVSNANGYDIMFTSDAAGTQKLNHEIESYNATTGQFIAWVQVPAVSHTADTVIYLFYGNASIVTSQENKPGVWDGGYQGVYHLGNGVALGLSDSTINANTLTNSGANAAAGEIAGGGSFNGSSSSMTCGMANYPSGNSPYTISGWMSPIQNTHRSKLLSYGNSGTSQGTFFGIDQNNAITIDHYSNDYTSSVTIPDGAWTYLTVTYDGTTDTVYRNGALAFSHVPQGPLQVALNACTIGSYLDRVNDLTLGSLDEIRVSNSVRSSDWIATEYNNQSSPATFYTLGTESSGGSTISATVSTIPSGLGITVDGTGYVAPQTFQWTPGTLHTIAVSSPISGGTGTQYVFSSWSDAGAMSHSVMAPSSSTAYTASFNTQYQLSTAAGPAGVGSISPASGGWYNAGSVVSVSATANSGYQFTGFSGSLTGTTTPQTLTMSAASSVTAAFSAGSSSGYSYQRTITIAHSQVPNTDQSKFPLLFSSIDPLLKSAANGGHVSNANGYDIVFTSDAAGTQKLNHEIESYNATTGQFIAWVQVPAVSHTADTVIYLFYGNASIVTSQENKPGVWDAGYQGVYHLGNGVALGLSDSTINANTLTNSGANAAAGEIAGGGSFNGSSSSMTCGMANYPSGNSPYTISGWMSPIQNTHRSKLLSYGNSGTLQGTFFGIDQNNAITIDHYSNDYTSSVTIPDGAWTYLTVTYDGTTDTVYRNGALAFSHVPQGPLQVVLNACTVGSYLDRVNDLTLGSLDEIRVSNAVRSSDWIATEYNNQSSPATFYTLGTESGGG